MGVCQSRMAGRMNWKPISASMGPGTAQAMKESRQQEQGCSYMQGTVTYEVHWYVDYVYVTGFWKTDRNVTLGLFHFIGPANAYTHTLHIRTAIIRLG